MRCALRQQRDLNPLCGMRAGYLNVTGAFDMPVLIRFRDPLLAPFTAVKRSRYTHTEDDGKRAEKTRCQKSIVMA
jgi:hypothetical protein